MDKINQVFPTTHSLGCRIFLQRAYGCRKPVQLLPHSVQWFETWTSWNPLKSSLHQEPPLDLGWHHSNITQQLSPGCPHRPPAHSSSASFRGRLAQKPPQDMNRNTTQGTRNFDKYCKYLQDPVKEAILGHSSANQPEKQASSTWQPHFQRYKKKVTPVEIPEKRFQKSIQKWLCCGCHGSNAVFDLTVQEVKCFPLWSNF